MSVDTALSNYVYALVTDGDVLETFIIKKT